MIPQCLCLRLQPSWLADLQVDVVERVRRGDEDATTTKHAANKHGDETKEWGHAMRGWNATTLNESLRVNDWEYVTCLCLAMFVIDKKWSGYWLTLLAATSEESEQLCETVRLTVNSIWTTSRANFDTGVAPFDSSQCVDYFGFKKQVSKFFFKNRKNCKAIALPFFLTKTSTIEFWLQIFTKWSRHQNKSTGETPMSKFALEVVQMDQRICTWRRLSKAIWTTSRANFDMEVAPVDLFWCLDHLVKIWSQNSVVEVFVKKNGKAIAFEFLSILKKNFVACFLNLK